MEAGELKRGEGGGRAVEGCKKKVVGMGMGSRGGEGGGVVKREEKAGDSGGRGWRVEGGGGWQRVKVVKEEGGKREGAGRGGGGRLENGGGWKRVEGR